MATAASSIAPAQASPSLAPFPSARVFSKHPMLWAAASFALGVLWARLASDSSRWTPPNWPIFAAILLVIFAGISLQRQPLAACGIALLAIAMLGRAQFGLERRGATAPLPQELDNQDVEVTGFVTRAALPVLETSASNPDSEEGAQETYQQIDMKAEAIRVLDQDGTRLASPPGMGAGIGVRIGAYGLARPTSDHDLVQDSSGPAAHEFHYGQRLQVRGRIRAPQTYGDPGVFDRRTYLLDNGIAATLSAKLTEIEVLPGHGGSRWGALRSGARRSLLRHVLALETPEESTWRIFSIGSKDAALLAAMILRERSLLDQSVKLDFQRTGAYHLLIVSGMAVAILAFSVFWLARLLRVPDSAGTILSVLFVGLYVSVTDLGAPVQRAASMCVVYMLARLLYRERNPLNALGVAAIVALLIDPHALFDAGFQMTFLAVLTIAGITVPVIERTTAPYWKALRHVDSTSYDLHLLPGQAQFRLELRMIVGRLELLMPEWMARSLVIGGLRFAVRAIDLLLISVLMQATLALPMAIYFHRATTLALPANLVVVPIMSLLLPVAIATTLLSYLGAWIVFIPRCITALLLHLVGAGVITFARVRAADLRVPDPATSVVALSCIAIAACFVTAKRRFPLLAGSLLLLLVADLALVSAHKPDFVAGKLEITAIDVAQGDSILVITPRGKALLIDAGGVLGATRSGFDVGEEVASNYLWERGVSHLDAIALTHAHGDHIGGLPIVLKNFHPRELWVAPSPPTRALTDLITEANRLHITVLRRVAGDKFDFGGAHFDVLAPSSDAILRRNASMMRPWC